VRSDALQQTPNTANKVDVQKAKEEWRTDFMIAFSDITQGDGQLQNVLTAIAA
jgi:hypothetical protein